MLGIAEIETNFDAEIIMYINSVFLTLNQLGVGPAVCYMISSKAQIWDEFFEGRLDLEAVKTYVYVKTRLVFDPPMSSFILDSLERLAIQHEWRLLAQVEPIPVEEVVLDEA